MGFDRRTTSLTIPDPAATTVVTMNLRSEYVRPVNFKIYADVADAVRLRLTDADSRVCYLDAADKDYNTAAIYTLMGTDDVTTGTGPKATDSVGALAAAFQTAPMPVMKNPIEVGIVNGAAATTVTFELDYEYGVFQAIEFVLPAGASNTATLTKHLRSKYAQIVGFRAQSVGTSVSEKLKITDVDGKIVFLDATAQTYEDTVNTDKILLIDPTVTGLTQVVPRQNTGASLQAGVGSGVSLPIVRSPITFTMLEDEADDAVVTATVYYKTG